MFYSVTENMKDGGFDAYIGKKAFEKKRPENSAEKDKNGFELSRTAWFDTYEEAKAYLVEIMNDYWKAVSADDPTEFTGVA